VGGSPSGCLTCIKLRAKTLSGLQKELVRVWALVCAQECQNHSVFSRDCVNPSPTPDLALACERVTMHTCSHTSQNTGPDIILHHQALIYIYISQFPCLVDEDSWSPQHGGSTYYRSQSGAC
jgi:hypothetical protein